jgi:hypothetical protein
MPIFHFNKATDPANAEDVWINTGAVRFAETARPGQLGKTSIHLIGQGEAGILVEEDIETVLGSMSKLVAAPRHYLGGTLPEHGAQIVYVAPELISYLRPGTPKDPVFWYIYFVDGSELRIHSPIPPGFK